MQLKDLLREFDEELAPNYYLWGVELEGMTNPLRAFITRAFEEGEQKGREESKVDGFYGVSAVEYEVIVGKARRTVLDEAIREVEGRKTDERKVAEFGDWLAETYEEKMLVNAVLDEVVKILNKMKG